MPEDKVPLTQRPEYADRYTVGLGHGWTHAAWLDANPLATDDYPAPTYDGFSATDAEIGYADGWAEGVKRFENDENVDGTPIADD
jgi:hypothetical protein